MTQRPLPLPDGFHVGPLFEIRKQRLLVRPHGKEGVIHRAQTKRATPPWLTDDQRQQIRDVYADAQALTETTGELHVVDHVVPKCGKTVCGLHVPWNLQPMHWKPNAQKGAFTWPDMWNEQMELL
jgi:hypothetical protein